MTFLPVVERELRVAARRRGAYWGRFVAAAVGAALAAWVLLTINDSEKNIGADLFAVVSAVVFIYATVAGTLVTCDCLSEEKREGTLGLLFLTDLKGHDVVLGKLAATSVNAFYGMLAVLPMLSIPFILGGVSRDETLRVVLVSINLLFFFLSAGLFVSALCRKDNWALGLSILLGLAFVLAGPVASLFKIFHYSVVARLFSPAAGCFLAFDENYTTDPHFYFWLNAAITQAYIWIFFGLACRIVPRSWQDAATGKKVTWRRATASVLSDRTRTAMLEANPFLWRAARSGRKRPLVWLTLGVLAVIWWWCVSSAHWDPGVDLVLLVPAGLVLKAWLAAAASRALSEDRRSGGLELLLSTPLRESDIVRGQLGALWRQFGPPAAAVLLANMLFVLKEFPQWEAGDRMSLLKLHLIVAGFLAGDMIALSWAGMWLGLIHRNPNRAAMMALVRIVVVPTVTFFLLMSLWSLTATNKDPISAIFMFWLALGIGADVYFGLDAFAKLRAQFRTVVAEGLARKRRSEPVPKPPPVLAEAQ